LGTERSGNCSSGLEQSFDGDSRYSLRAAVAAHAAAAGLTPQRVYNVVAAAHELAANAVRHGAGHGRLRLWADGQALHCQVTDDGPPDQDPARQTTAARQPEHSHGLWIINQIADQVSLNRAASGTTVTIIFLISPPS
jgi:anti-sigma regulatory factor (Ser/Thr protein kinase)